MDDLNFGIATCCHPLPGDEIVAYTPDGSRWIVHRTNCPEAIELMARSSARIIHARWSNSHMNTYLGGLKISGFDRKSMISDIIRVISDDFFLVLIITADGNYGKGRYLIGRAALKFRDELI